MNYKDYKKAVCASVREHKEVVLAGRYEKAKYTSIVMEFLGISDAVILSEEIIDKVVHIKRHDPRASIVVKPSINAKGLLDIEICRSLY